jgi:uncharacterized protein (UPF0276 family)
MTARVGISMNRTEAFRDAVIPLVEAGLVDAIERELDESFVLGTDHNPAPRWVTALDEVFAADDALYGHGVWFSLLSAGWQSRQDAWLERVVDECARVPYRHISEHFGYMSAGAFRRFPMLSVPYCDAAVALGVERVRLLSQAIGQPLGLENTAAALGPDDATTQAAFLRDILVGAGGWLVLDCYNVWVQAQNLGLDPRALIDAYPLELVRELHIAGGVHYPVRSGAPVLLDSHDGPVPHGAKELLVHVLPRCPNAEVVIVERRDGTWDDAAEVEAYRADYADIHRLVQEAS